MHSESKMKIWVLLPLVISLAGCAIWAPGQDPHGREMVGNANNILSALNAYHEKNNTNPNSLEELVPEYLDRIPKEPSVLYKPSDGSLFFTYSPTWPQQGHVACTGEIGQHQVGCGGYW